MNSAKVITFTLDRRQRRFEQREAQAVQREQERRARLTAIQPLYEAGLITMLGVERATAIHKITDKEAAIRYLTYHTTFTRDRAKAYMERLWRLNNAIQK